MSGVAALYLTYNYNMGKRKVGRRRVDRVQRNPPWFMSGLMDRSPNVSCAGMCRRDRYALP